jgi:hypothetical protein
MPYGITLDLGNFYGTPPSTKNLLLIGSKAYNKESKEIMKNLGDYTCNFPVNKHLYFSIGTNDYKCEDQDKGKNPKVIEDYGIIVRRLKEDKLVLLLAGIHMHGTLAAMEVALMNTFQSEVKRKGYKYFAQLVNVEVDRDDGLGIISTSIKWEDYPLVQLT